MAWARDRRVALVVMAGVLLLMFGWLAFQFLLGSAVAQINEDLADPNRSRGAVNPVVAAVTYTFLVNIAYFGGAVLGGQAAWNAARRRARLAAPGRDAADTRRPSSRSTPSSRSASASPVSCTTSSPTTCR